LVNSAARLVAGAACAWGAFEAVAYGGVIFYVVACVMALLTLSSLAYAIVAVLAVVRPPSG
jgi:hypothetical protein